MKRSLLTAGEVADIEERLRIATHALHRISGVVEDTADYNAAFGLQRISAIVIGAQYAIESPIVYD